MHSKSEALKKKMKILSFEVKRDNKKLVLQQRHNFIQLGLTVFFFLVGVYSIFQILYSPDDKVPDYKAQITQDVVITEKDEKHWFFGSPWYIFSVRVLTVALCWMLSFLNLGTIDKVKIDLGEKEIQVTSTTCFFLDKKRFVYNLEDVEDFGVENVPHKVYRRVTIEMKEGSVVPLYWSLIADPSNDTERLLGMIKEFVEKKE